MQQEGYRVEEVSNGQQCLAAYTDLYPDIILLDGMMPVMDGFTCCSQVRLLPGGERIPILIITGLDDEASGIGLLMLVLLIMSLNRLIGLYYSSVCAVYFEKRN